MFRFKITAVKDGDFDSYFAKLNLASEFRWEVIFRRRG